ncbi:hypothetical protein F4805DRAFT_418616 [Annulohypoxylon moriforme]|nr:hypothetical protein F4805DRAFT_418616 [Annulohypoxylon moriforme]
MKYAKPTEATILAALDTYRKRVGQLNHRNMSILIPQIESVKADDPDLFESPEEEEEARLEYLLRILDTSQEDTQPPISRPSDLLKNWDVLAPQLSLDGVCITLDPEQRGAKREAYKSGILRGLAQFECPTGTWTFPPDFEILMQHVDSLEGHGWPQRREWDGYYIFWEGWGPRSHHGDFKNIGEKCMSEEAIHKLGFDEYDVAAGFECGIGLAKFTVVMYSRLKGDTREDGWMWRYGAWMGQFGFEVYDDIVSFLEWYQRYNEREGEGLTLTAQDVFEF